MKAHSVELRRKIIKAHEDEAISLRKFARRFGVALSCVQKLLKQYREADSLTPKIWSQQIPAKLTTEHLAVIQQLAEAQNDATWKSCEHNWRRKLTS